MTYTIRTSYRMWAEGPSNPFALLPGSPGVVYDQDLLSNTWALEKNGKAGSPVKISKNPCEDIRKALLEAGAKPAEQHKKPAPPPPPNPNPDPEEAPAQVDTTTPTQETTAGTPAAILAESVKGGQMVWQL